MPQGDSHKGARPVGEVAERGFKMLFTGCLPWVGDAFRVFLYALHLAPLGLSPLMSLALCWPVIGRGGAWWYPSKNLHIRIAPIRMEHSTGSRQFHCVPPTNPQIQLLFQIILITSVPWAGPALQ